MVNTIGQGKAKIHSKGVKLEEMHRFKYIGTRHSSYDICTEDIHLRITGFIYTGFISVIARLRTAFSPNTGCTSPPSSLSCCTAMKHGPCSLRWIQALQVKCCPVKDLHVAAQDWFALDKASAS